MSSRGTKETNAKVLHCQNYLEYGSLLRLFHGTTPTFDPTGLDESYENEVSTHGVVLS
jgi:hypothetical protein